MATTAAWGAFICAHCKTETPAEKKHTRADEHWICESCVQYYKPCGDCGLLIPQAKPASLCIDCESW